MHLRRGAAALLLLLAASCVCCVELCIKYRKLFYETRQTIWKRLAFASTWLILPSASIHSSSSKKFMALSVHVGTSFIVVVVWSVLRTTVNCGA
jgi:hypothetical protein